ncbi:unnamed protein product [Symbiodinium microadriaticum]|nr:unnamed protein product [Symbiodinium microadriaticum]
MEEVVGAVKDSRVNLNSQDLSNILQAFATAATKDQSLLEVVAGRGARAEKLAPQASANAGRSAAVPGHCGHQLLKVLSAKSASKMFELTPQALANAAQWWGTLSARKRKLSAGS